MSDRTLATLDPFIRVQIQKRGISFLLHTYTGFDTEYTIKNEKKCLNKLISVQLAVQCRVFIKVPLYQRYEISYVHPLTSEITSYYKPRNMDWVNKALERSNSSKSGTEKIKVNEMNLLNESIKIGIDLIRELKYLSIDTINAEFIDLLHSVTGVRSFEDMKKDQIVFVLPLSKVNTRIEYPLEEVGYTLVSLVNQSNSMVEEDLNNNFELFTSLLGKMNYNGNLNKLLEWFKNCNKPRGRSTLSFNTQDRLSITLTKKLFIIAHYNAADLAMLKDFKDFQEDVNIVGKSFVTLGKPLEIEGSFVYIRDTHLLSPASSKGLEALGKLYDEKLAKKSITQEDLEHMDEYLEKEPQLFEEYAIQDAIIPLTHAITLEQVNFTTKRIGIPLTLSSLGRSLVLTK